MGESDFNQFMRQKNQLVIAAKNIGGEHIFPPTQILGMSRGMHEQHKLTQRVVEIVVITNRTICVVMLRYNVDKPASSYADVRMRNEVDSKKQLSCLKRTI